MVSQMPLLSQMAFVEFMVYMFGKYREFIWKDFEFDVEKFTAAEVHLASNLSCMYQTTAGGCRPTRKNRSRAHTLDFHAVQALSAG